MPAAALRDLGALGLSTATGSAAFAQPRLYTESGQTLKGSFSAVSKPIFASKYSLESSRRDLHITLLCTALRSQIFVKKFAEKLRNFAKFYQKFHQFCRKFTEFDEILTGFRRNFTFSLNSLNIVGLPQVFPKFSPSFPQVFPKFPSRYPVFRQADALHCAAF